MLQKFQLIKTVLFIFCHEGTSCWFYSYTSQHLLTILASMLKLKIFISR